MRIYLDSKLGPLHDAAVAGRTETFLSHKSRQELGVLLGNLNRYLEKNQNVQSDVLPVLREIQPTLAWLHRVKIANEAGRQAMGWRTQAAA